MEMFWQRRGEKKFTGIEKLKVLPVTNPEPTSTTSAGKGRNHGEAGGASMAPASLVQVCSAGFFASGSI